MQTPKLEQPNNEDMPEPKFDHIPSVKDLIEKLKALPDQDAKVFVEQEDSELAYRVGDPFMTAGGDVVLGIGAIFIDLVDGDDEDADDEDADDEAADDEAADDEEYKKYRANVVACLVNDREELQEAAEYLATKYDFKISHGYKEACSESEIADAINKRVVWAGNK